jgi:hypothetical protein
MSSEKGIGRTIGESRMILSEWLLRSAHTSVCNMVESVERVVEVGGDRLCITTRIEVTNASGFARVVQSACMNLKPLLNLLSTHRAFRRSDGNMRVLDRYDHVCTPLTHDHMAAGQNSNVSYLLVAYLARQSPRHLRICLRGRSIGLVVQSRERSFRRTMSMQSMSGGGYSLRSQTQTLQLARDLLKRKANL